MNNRVIVRELTVALWVVTVGTIAAAMVLAAIDRLLIASAVCFLGGLPVALIAWGIERRTPPRSSAEKRAMGLRLGFRGATVGAASTTVGGVLLIAIPEAVGHLPEVLLSFGAMLILSGVTAQRYSRPQGWTAAEGSSSAEQTDTAPADRGVNLLLVRKNRYVVASWAAVVSALAGWSALSDLAPRPLIGASVLLLGGLPLAALALTSRRARDQESDT
ncbi:hypothetical protein APR04_003174 [Promicromonospora umidemergens]|uniref:SdpI/YhfL family protein n=1 Tax=Promicromonospora umidemergens TaxID=629679 RepID=A0ABP8XX59_9MICO|nr:hypothetical protein [Promicromonospora umidemergens]MCP2284254.1 hypothetical protein [Promicromonospora umidemergens]